MAKRKKKGKITSGITKKELAEIYGTTPRGLDAWLQGIEKKVGKLSRAGYTPMQLKIILAHIDLPDNFLPKNA